MATGSTYRLVGSDGSSQTAAEGQSLRLGRSPENEIVIADPRVSRRHATLVVQGGRCWIRDEGSTHGTFVNGLPVAGQQELRLGDAVQIGRAVFSLELAGSAPAWAPVESGEPRIPPEPAAAGRGAQRRQQVIWALGGALAGVLVVAALVLVLVLGGGDQGRRSDRSPGTAVESEVTERVSAETGGILELEDDGAVVILPRTLSEDAEVTVQTLGPGDYADLLDGEAPLSAIYEVTSTGSVDGEIELQLPYDDAGLSEAEELSLAVYCERDGQPVALATTVDPQANIAYARATHLTPFWVWLNPWDNPKVERVWSSPVALSRVQPAYPVADLTVSATVDDDNLERVQARYSFCTLAGIFTAEAYEFIAIAEHLHRAELILEGGLNSPPVHTDFVPEERRQGRGRCEQITEWVDMGEAPSGDFASTILLEEMDWGPWESLKLELYEIKVEVRAEDEDGQLAEDSILVPVVHGPIASDIERAKPDLLEPVFTQRPDFTWQWVDGTSVEAARFYLAKGYVLWPDEGRPSYVIRERTVGWIDQEMLWQPGDPDLDAGLYCWGLEVSYDNEVFGERDDIRTGSHCFYVREEGAERIAVTIAPRQARQGEQFEARVSGMNPKAKGWVNVIWPGHAMPLDLELQPDRDGEARFTIDSSELEPGLYTAIVYSISPYPDEAQAQFEVLAGESGEEGEYVVLEEFDDASAFSSTDSTNAYVDEAASRAVLNVSRSHQRVLYRTVPEIRGDFRLTVVGQFDRNSNNCDIRVGLGDSVPQGGSQGPGAYIAFAWFGGGCSNRATHIRANWLYTAGGGSGTHQGFVCGGSMGSIIPIQQGVPYKAVLEVRSTEATLSVYDQSGNRIGSLSGPVEGSLGEPSLLWLGLAGGGDFPTCSGSFDRVTVESLP